MNQIKTLLGDTQLSQQIKEANNLAEVITLIMDAGIDKGHDFTLENISQMMTKQITSPTELGEQDLLAVAGGRICINSADLSSNCLPTNAVAVC